MNRQAFESAIKEHSPLTVPQFERLFGGEVTDDNKALAWAFMQLTAKHQMACYNFLSAFPGAYVETVK